MYPVSQTCCRTSLKTTSCIGRFGEWGYANFHPLQVSQHNQPDRLPNPASQSISYTQRDPDTQSGP